MSECFTYLIEHNDWSFATPVHLDLLFAIRVEGALDFLTVHVFQSRVEASVNHFEIYHFEHDSLDLGLSEHTCSN